jgi:hypothetical protein
MSAPGSVKVYDREIRGVPLWMVREYLEQLGGQSKVDGWLKGPGWKARLTPLDDYRIGSLCVGQVRLELQGDAKAVAEVRDALEKRLLRAGG